MERIVRVGGVILLFSLAPISARAQEHVHPEMASVVIPKGAPYTEADVRFMQGMIAHHAQAIYMSRMARAHGATRACSDSPRRSISRRSPRSP